MVTAPMIVFGVSLSLIVALFILKFAEARRDARLAEQARTRADEQALRLKSALVTAESRVELTPWFLGALTRYGVHIGALSFARLARTSAEYAHAIADFVSHKRSFERRETTSQYLKMVGGRSDGAPAPASIHPPAPYSAPEPVPYVPEPVGIPESEPKQELAPRPKPASAQKHTSRRRRKKVAAK